MSVETKQNPTAEAEIKQQLAESLDLPKNEKKSKNKLKLQLESVREEIIEFAEEAAKPEEFANTEKEAKTKELLSKMNFDELKMVLKLIPKKPKLLEYLEVLYVENNFESGQATESIERANAITPAEIAAIQKINDEAKAKLELDRDILETNYRIKSKEKPEGVEGVEEAKPEFGKRSEIFAKSSTPEDDTILVENDIDKAAKVDLITSAETQKFLLENGIKRVSFADQMNEQIKLDPTSVAERVIKGEKVGSPFFIELSAALEKIAMTPDSNIPEQQLLQKLWLENSSKGSQEAGKLGNFREVLDSIRKTQGIDGSKSKEIVELYGKVIQNLIKDFNGWKNPTEKIEPKNNIVNFDRKKSPTPTAATSQR
jgi:hypothetical protein